MNISSILSDFANQANGGGLKKVTNAIPGGLAGGAVAGGIVAALLGSKSVRKTATKAAKYGGTALLGGMAFKAYQSWQQNKSQASDQTSSADVGRELRSDHRQANSLSQASEPADHLQIALIKAMIAAARADGSIDSDEQAKISKAIENLNLEPAERALLLELFIKPIEVDDIICDLETLEQKAEIYLASCLVIELDHQSEYVYLSNLARALDLPQGLEQQLREQAVGVH